MTTAWYVVTVYVGIPSVKFAGAPQSVKRNNDVKEILILKMLVAQQKKPRSLFQKGITEVGMGNASTYCTFCT